MLTFFANSKTAIVELSGAEAEKSCLDLNNEMDKISHAIHQKGNIVDYYVDSQKEKVAIIFNLKNDGIRYAVEYIMKEESPGRFVPDEEYHATPEEIYEYSKEQDITPVEERKIREMPLSKQEEDPEVEERVQKLKAPGVILVQDSTKPQDNVYSISGTKEGEEGIEYKLKNISNGKEETVSREEIGKDWKVLPPYIKKYNKLLKDLGVTGKEGPDYSDVDEEMVQEILNESLNDYLQEQNEYLLEEGQEPISLSDIPEEISKRIEMEIIQTLQGEEDDAEEIKLTPEESELLPGTDEDDEEEGPDQPVEEPKEEPQEDLKTKNIQDRIKYRVEKLIQELAPKIQQYEENKGISIADNQKRKLVTEALEKDNPSQAKNPEKAKEITDMAMEILNAALGQTQESPLEVSPQLEKLRGSAKEYTDQIPKNIKFKGRIEQQLAKHEDTKGIKFTEGQRKKIIEKYLEKWNMSPKYYWSWVKKTEPVPAEAIGREAFYLEDLIKLGATDKVAAELDTMMSGEEKDVVDTETGDKVTVTKTTVDSGEEIYAVKDNEEEKAYTPESPELQKLKEDDTVEIDAEL